MPDTRDIRQEIRSQMTGRYAAWFVPGAWWVVSLEADELVITPDLPPARAAGECLN